jgi:nucleotide-binding universal stress UspA family protein
MDLSQQAHVLVVANRTAATPALAEAVRSRAALGPATFHLLVPDPAMPDWHPHHTLTMANHVLELSIPILDEAAGAQITGSVSSRRDPMDAIEEILREQDFDEIILSTLPRSISRWLHLDLPRRVASLGLPLTTIIAVERAASLSR